MTSCPACAEFERNPRTHSFNSACLECQARSIAGSPAYFNSAASKTILAPYAKAMRRAFSGNWLVWHERVKHYAGLVEKAKVKA